MPSATPQLSQFSHVPETQEDLEWADRKSRLLSVTPVNLNILTKALKQLQPLIYPSMEPRKEMQN